MTQAPPPANQPPVTWEAPSQPPPSDGGFSFSEFFSFRYLITPTFIRVIYILGAILITLSAFSYIPDTGEPAAGVVYAVLFVLIANLWWRIVLELVMVLFRINDSLSSIERRGRGL